MGEQVKVGKAEQRIWEVVEMHDVAAIPFLKFGIGHGLYSFPFDYINYFMLLMYCVLSMNYRRTLMFVLSQCRPAMSITIVEGKVLRLS